MLDEPTWGLDQETGGRVEALIASSLAGSTMVLIVTDDVAQAKALRVGFSAWTQANPKLARFEHAHRSRHREFGDCRRFVVDGAALLRWLRLRLERKLLIAALRIVV